MASGWHVEGAVTRADDNYEFEPYVDPSERCERTFVLLGARQDGATARCSQLPEHGGNHAHLD